MAVNADTGEVIGATVNPLARDVEKALNAIEWPKDGTYEDMYFSLDLAMNKLVKDIRRALFKNGIELSS